MNMEDTSEVLLKYQKLALEYSKLKAQATVLKNAVSEEQSNSSGLQETLKKKDQLVRKLEQEVECLNFRNVQLAKRVSVLQNDLESIDANPKHSKGKTSSNMSNITQESYSVLNLELQSRIEENEKLHQQIYSADLEYQKKISELCSTIETLQSKTDKAEKLYSEKLAEQEAIINSLQKEKIKMQVSLKNHEQEIKERKTTEETKTRDDISIKEDLASQLEDAKKVIEEKVFFNDRCVDSLNLLNVPIIQRGKHEHLCALMLKMQGFVSDFCRHLCDLHTFMIQRLCTTDLDSSIKPVSNKLEEYLRENIPNLKALPGNFQLITEALKSEVLTWDKSSVMNFATSFQKFEICLDKLMPFLILRIQNKNSWTASSPRLVDIISNLVTLSQKLRASFKKLYKYILLLAMLGSADKNQYHVSQAFIIGKVLLCIESLQLLFDEARRSFGSKITVDHQLPIMSQSEKSTDECILTALVSLSLTTRKVRDMLEKDQDAFSCDVWYKPRNARGVRNSPLNASVWQYKERGSQYMKHISQSEPSSVPHEVALKNCKSLYEQADSQENLRQQLEEYQNKLMQLELDKENWMLECQIIRAKELKSPDASSENLETKSQDYDEIHLYVKNTVNQLIKQIQFADSKAISYKDECEMMHQRLLLNLERKEALEQEIANLRKIIDRMKEEQKTLVQSYDEQLNTMSEHLANLNETLTAQKDEIDALRQAGTKSSKKGRSK